MRYVSVPPPPTTNKSCPGGVAGKWPAEWHFWRGKGERRGEKKETVGKAFVGAGRDHGQRTFSPPAPAGAPAAEKVGEERGRCWRKEALTKMKIVHFNRLCCSLPVHFSVWLFLFRLCSITTASIATTEKAPAMSDTSLITNTSCLHVSDVDASVKWYEDAFGVSVIHKLSTEKFTSAFVAVDAKGHPDAGLPVSQRDGVIELRQLKGEAAKPKVEIHNGNTEPYKGFGHLCFAVSNIAEAQKHLLSQGVEFKKKLEDGRQKNIAFVLDPDQYWVELIENGIDKEEGYKLASNRMNHTMVRVKDPVRSLEFYRGVLGMKLFSKREFPDAQFTLYFVGYDHTEGYTEGKEQSVEQASRQSIIELTHNWGTENDSSFKGYYVFGGTNHNDDSVVGFDHFSVSCKDSGKFLKELTSRQVIFLHRDIEAATATVTDPDGWRVGIHSYDYLK